MTTPAYQIIFEDRDEFLYVHLTGRDSLAASLAYWGEIAEKAKELDLRRVLVHEALEGEVNEGEMFEIITGVVPSGRGVRVAFFDENQANVKINALGQLIAENRGALIKIFPTLKAAENWIGSDE